MNTSLQQICKIQPSELGDILFSDRKAKDIYKWQQFKAVDGKIYDVWNVYTKTIIDYSTGVNWWPMPTKEVVRINVGGGGWWNPNDVIEWIKGSLGEGMAVCIDGEYGIIKCVQPNRVCHVEFNNGSYKSYQENKLNQLVSISI